MDDWADSWLNLSYDAIKLRLRELGSAFHVVRVIDPYKEKVVELHKGRVEYLASVCDAP